VGTLFLETVDDAQKTHEAILKSLSVLNYEIKEDNDTRIVASHKNSFRLNMFPHTVKIEFSSTPEKSYLNLNIDHNRGGDYCEKLLKKMVEILPSIRTSSEQGLIFGNLIKESDLKELEGFLENNESLEGVFSGTVAGKMSSFKTQWLVVTDKRVIFYGRAFVGASSDSFSYTEISSVQGQRSLVLGSIELNVRGKTERFENMQKSDVDKATELIRRNIEKSKTTKEVKEVKADPLDQLKKLKELFDMGAISEDEYQEKKKSLLNKI